MAEGPIRAVSAGVEDRISYGGQAVLEGVMMRSRSRVATAVRHPGGKIVVRTEMLSPGRLSARFRKAPVLRGVFAMWDILVVGARSLAFSANVSLEGPGTSENGERDSGQDPSGASQEVGSAFVWSSLAIGLVLGVALFLVAPLFIARIADPLIGSDILSNLLEGLIRLAILVAYLVLMGLLPDLRRTFAYHGAEHKTVNAVEAGEDLTVENVMRHSSAHPRCGTSFLLIVVLLSVLVFALLGRPDLPYRIASRVVLVPFIAGLGFELIRFLSARRNSPLALALLGPGMWLQAATTRTPDRRQVEVAIVAMAQVLEGEGEFRLLRLAPELEIELRQ